MQPDSNLLNSLTPRQREVLALLVEGKRDRQIADELVIHVRTVYNHTHAIYQKLGVSGRFAAMAFAIRNGILPDKNREDSS